MRLLLDFIEKKTGEYFEPHRKGTPRGEPIGLSLNKHHAALLALTSVPLREQAKMIGTTYAMICKWRIEERFWRAAASHTLEFAFFFMERYAVELVDPAEHLREYTKGLNETPLDGVTEYVNSRMRSWFHEDRAFYNDATITALSDVHRQAMLDKPKMLGDLPVDKRPTRDNIDAIHRRFLTTLLRIRGGKGGQLVDLVSQHDRLQLAKQLLLKPELSTLDQKEAAMFVHLALETNIDLQKVLVEEASGKKQAMPRGRRPGNIVDGKHERESGRIGRWQEDVEDLQALQRDRWKRLGATSPKKVSPTGSEAEIPKRKGGTKRKKG